MLKSVKNTILDIIRQADLLLLTLCTVTSLFGVVMIYSATRYNNDNRKIIVQTAALLIGIVVYFGISMIDLEMLIKRWKWIAALDVLFILLLKTPFGVSDDTGNTAWLKFPFLPVSIGPAEVVKITFIILLAWQLQWLREEKRDLRSFSAAFYVGGHTLGIAGLYFVISGDMGNALMFLLIFVVMSFVAGFALRWFALLFGASGAVIGGIIAGIFTATEGAAIAVLYALVLGICYGNITVRSFWRIVTDSARMSGMVVFLIGVSNILGWVMAFTQIPQAVSAALLGFTSSPAALLLIMNAVLLLAGTFLDVTPAILIFTPLFLPVVEAFGMHPVQFGLILVYNLCIGNITPPVGNTLFVAIKVGKTSLSEVMPYMLWYYGAILSGLLLVTFVPAVSLGLPWLTGVLK